MVGDALIGRPPALLLNPLDYGPLAAARCLGRAGIPVTLAGGRLLSAARWSKYVTRRVAYGGDRGLQRSMEWLLDFGRVNPGHVLCAEQDTTVWWMAVHREALAVNFHHALPSAEAVFRLLDKGTLVEAAGEVGIESPMTWAPESEEDLRETLGRMPFPVVIKPRTHAGLLDWKRGEVVATPSHFFDGYAEMRSRARFAPEVAALHPAAAWPIVQRYHPLTPAGVYNVTGFIDSSSSIFVAQATSKLIQTPRRLGIGVAFEAAPLDPDLAGRILDLCRHVGFHGIFEVEFLLAEGRKLLIDFNPRYFHGMALEIARGMPLPLLGYLDAIGDREGIERVVAAVKPDHETLGLALSFGLELDVVLRGQRFTGGLTKAEARWIRDWRRRHAGSLTDAVRDRDDPVPGRINAIRQAWQAVRHPRGFAGTYLFNR